MFYCTLSSLARCFCLWLLLFTSVSRFFRFSLRPATATRLNDSTGAQSVCVCMCVCVSLICVQICLFLVNNSFGFSSGHIKYTHCGRVVSPSAAWAWLMGNICLKKPKVTHPRAHTHPHAPTHTHTCIENKKQPLTSWAISGFCGYLLFWKRHNDVIRVSANCHGVSCAYPAPIVTC